MFQKFLFSFIFLFFSLTSHLCASAAGVLPLFERNGEAYTCLGEELRGFCRHRFKAWSDFGGRRDRSEGLNETAFREFREETANSFPDITLSDVSSSRYYDHHRVNRRGRPHIYRQYFVDMRGREGAGGPVTSERMWNNAQAVQNRPGTHHVEKTDYVFVKVSDLLQAVISDEDLRALLPTNKNLRGPHHPYVSQVLHLHRRFRRLLKQHESQQILADFVKSVTRRFPDIRKEVGAVRANGPVVQTAIINKLVNTKKRVRRQQSIPARISLARVNVAKPLPTRLANGRVSVLQREPVLKQVNITKLPLIKIKRSIPVRRQATPVTRNKIMVVARRQKPLTTPEKIVVRRRPVVAARSVRRK